MPIVFKNLAKTYLSSNITSITTSITVYDGTQLPDITAPDEYFYATIYNDTDGIEIIKVTNKVGNVLTVERGVDGTISRPFNVDSPIEQRLTAETMREFQERIARLEYKISVLGG